MTGKYTSNGEYLISVTAQAPSVHSETGLSVELLGDRDGYRVYYHDSNRAVNQLSYTPDDNWRYAGVVSYEPAAGMAIASAHSPNNNNISLAYPIDTANMLVSRYNTDKKWHLCK